MNNQDLFKIQSLKNLCDTYKMVPSKKYGQNFLINPTIIEKIIESAELQKTDEVIEVGPGFGSLTLSLAKKVKKVVSYEIEKKIQDYWVNILKNKEYSNISIKWGNILKQKDIDLKKYKVVANLPYQITSAVIRKFLNSNSIPDTMVLMVQKEVAERICAKPGQLSVLAVSIQLYGIPSIVTKVSKNNFWPVPAVDSAVLKIKKKKKVNVDEKLFFKLVKIGFSSKRKTLINNLISFFGREKKDQIIIILDHVKIPQKARAQDLSVESWLALFQKVEKLM